MRTLTIDELRDLAPAYAMDTLAPNERAAFEAALASSPELAAEVAEHRAVVEALAVERSVAPSPALRERLLERIAAERPATRQAGARAGAPRRRWIPTVLVTALAASLVLAVAQERSAASARDELRETLRERDSALAAAATRIRQRDTQINTILGAERQLVVVYLVGNDASLNAPGMQLFWNLRQGRGELHAFRIPPARTGHAYQLWLIKDGRPVPVHMFNSNADGHGVAAGFVLPRDPKGVSALTVTEEPVAGSPQPTSTPLLTASVSRVE